MTVEEKLWVLIQRLLTKTQEGQVHWEKTAIAGVFQTAFPSYIVKLSPRSNDFVISIINEYGSVVETSDDVALAQAFPSSGVYAKMQELHELARREALGVDAALDSLLGELG